MERLPVDQLERGAVEGGCPRERAAHRLGEGAGLANSQTEIDVATFTQWVNAYAQEQTELADFYFKRFREEFRPAVDAWVATTPLENPDAPLTPFAMPQYKVAARTEADRLDAARRCTPRRRAGTSSARRTTCSASSSSPPPCSSRA